MNKSIRIFLFLLCFCLLLDRPVVADDPSPTNAMPQNFLQAKRLLENKVYNKAADRKTFYCGCTYSRKGNIDASSCGYVPKSPDNLRSQRVEWEHIVPVSVIGQGRACWVDGHAECVNSKGKSYRGRKCCQKVDAEFRRIEADPYNIVPAIGELNADRQNFAYSEIPGEKREYGACDFEVDRKRKIVEPAIPLRGFIGRTWIYMHRVYNVPVSAEDLKLYQAWADLYPPQQWEISRIEKINKAILLK